MIMSKIKITPLRLAGAILFAVLALTPIFTVIQQFILFIQRADYRSIAQILPTFLGSAFSSFLWIAAYALIAIALFLNKRNIFITIGFSASAVLSLGSLFSGLLNIFKYVMYYNELWDWVSAAMRTFANLFVFIGWLGALAIFLIAVYQPLRAGMAKKLWFLPAACIALTMILRMFTDTINFVTYSTSFSGMMAIITNAMFFFLLAAALLAACVWIVHPDDTPESVSTDTAENADNDVSEQDF